MLALVIGVVIGILIGWNWAQPQPVKDLQDRLMSFVRSSTNRSDR
ncbi:hypothetical protein EDC35_109134 [Thiobaca trueperi]|uniref:Uncharacterized protein n=1 Tax=Thiobaca trueperi TaxID=127458 RepID=A0A4R3MTC4_9GAMM|nr:hypothetical protein EDC35_109134 [Thiobaca trueperi]